MREHIKTFVIVTVLVMLTGVMSGCALINAPFQLVGGTINALGQVLRGVFEVVKAMPKPPPGVF